MREELEDAWKILRMYHATGRPALQLLQRQAEVIQAWAVDEFELTAGRERRDQPSNAIYDQPRLALARSQRVLSALPLVDVRQQLAPANDMASWIAKGKSFVLKPTIDAVRPPEALRDLVWTA